MIELPPQCNTALLNQFQSFDYTNSVWIGGSKSDPMFSIWSCAIPQIPNAIGLWIGDLPNFLSYLALKQSSYGGLEAFRAWTDPIHRGKGLASELLSSAMAFDKIFSDSQGLTQDYYNVWRKHPNVRYFDGTLKSLVNSSNIPPQELFTPWAQGSRWHMVLS